MFVDGTVDAKMSYKFSPLSLLKDYPRCFWLNFNKNIKRPDSIFPSLPGGMDKVPNVVEMKPLEIKKTDQEIDELVYKLYGLTKEEIKIIEESLY